MRADLRLAFAMPRVFLVVACIMPLSNSVFCEDLMNDPALKAFRVTTEKVEKVIDATHAMQQAVKDDPEFRKEYLAEQSVTATLDENIRAIEAKRPRHAALIRSIGLTTKDYLLTSLALFQADAIYRNQKGTAEFKNSVNPENLLFVRKHRREVNRAVREIETLN